MRLLFDQILDAFWLAVYVAPNMEMANQLVSLEIMQLGRDFST